MEQEKQSWFAGPYPWLVSTFAFLLPREKWCQLYFFNKINPDKKPIAGYFLL